MIIYNVVYIQVIYNPKSKNIAEVFISNDSDFYNYKRLTKIKSNSFVCYLNSNIYDTLTIEDRKSKYIKILFETEEDLQKFTFFPQLERKYLLTDSYLLNLGNEYILFTKYNVIDNKEIEITEYLRGAFLSKKINFHEKGKKAYIGKFAKINLFNIKPIYIKIVESGSFTYKKLSNTKAIKIEPKLNVSLHPQIIHINKNDTYTEILIFDRDISKSIGCGVYYDINNIQAGEIMLLSSKIKIEFNNEYIICDKLPIKINGNIDKVKIIKINENGLYSLPITISIPNKKGKYIYHFDELYQSPIQVLSVRI